MAVVSISRDSSDQPRTHHPVRRTDLRSVLSSLARAASVAAIDPDSTPYVSKRRAQATQDARRKTLRALQERLYAEGERSLLVVLQGMDTSGKDGTIKHVLGHVNPLGVHIRAFKAPTANERRHGFLWRIRRSLPPPGFIGVFNRSHYEDVLITRVHNLAPASEVERRYDQINEFEAELETRGITVVKILLLISYEEQRRRLLDRLEHRGKRWKLSPNDIVERGYWGKYQEAYQIAVTRCSRPVPWYIIPANRKWYRNWAVSQLLVETLTHLHPSYPQSAQNIAFLEQRLRAPDDGPGRR